MAKPMHGMTGNYVFDEIPIDLIDYDEQQLREIQVDDEIHELASSISSSTMLQLPGVIRTPNGRFQLCWGRRRLEAFKLKRADKIPCRIFDGTSSDVKALALVENLQRRQMSIREECDGVAHLYHDQHLSVDQIVTRLGRTRAWVNQRLALPNFRPDVREACLSGSLSLGAADAIEGCPDEAARAYILSAAVDQRLSVATVRKMVEAAQDSPTQEHAIAAGVEAARTPHATHQLYVECAACRQPRKPEDLVFVRVCNDGCKESDHAGPTH